MAGRIINSRGEITTITYDRRRQLVTSIKRADGYEITYEYSTNGTDYKNKEDIKDFYQLNPADAPGGKIIYQGKTTTRTKLTRVLFPERLVLTKDLKVRFHSPFIKYEYVDSKPILFYNRLFMLCHADQQTRTLF